MKGLVLLCVLAGVATDSVSVENWSFTDDTPKFRLYTAKKTFGASRMLGRLSTRPTSHRRVARLGGKSPVDTSSEIFKNAMRYVVLDINQKSNALRAMIPVGYRNCFKELTSGLIYICDIQWAESGCMN